MTKEELEKEAEDFLQKKWGTSEMLILGGDARKVLADFAEPREKQIAELEAQIEKMKSDVKQLREDRMNDDTDQNIMDRLWEEWTINFGVSN